VGDSNLETVTIDPYSIHFSATASSDAGHRRKINEDAFVSEPMIYAVADGMGGHESGEKASRAVVRALVRDLAGTTPVRASAVVESIRAAHRVVMEIGEPGTVSGTTLSGVVLVADEGDQALRWMVVNVGDSRVYEWSDSALSQISVDHSAVQELVDSGAISAAEAESHPERNVVTRALGIEDYSEPDVWLMPLRDHQTFVICSDGLTKELSDGQIADVLRLDGENPARQLVSAALSRGGRDNVTVVVVSVRVERTDGEADPQLLGTEYSEDTAPRRDS
jgi:serine/threonine protein phosphatase PrpC